MEGKKTLYQVLQAPRTAASDIIKACYEARLRDLGTAATPEANSQRALLREAYEVLSDTSRRQQYEEKLREDARRALSRSGEGEVRARPANARSEDSGSSSSVNWIVVAGLLVVLVGGFATYYDHKRKAEAQRIEAARHAEEARVREAELKAKETDAQYRRDTVDWAKDRIDADRQEAAWRRQQYDRDRMRNQMRAEDERARREEAYAEQRQAQQERQAEYERQRVEQENLRRSQMQLERERRHLQELERNRPRNF
jgi:hypothetical protein